MAPGDDGDRVSSGSATWSRRRVGIAVGSVALLAAMSWPVISPTEIDSLPLSNYPMFARDRPAVSRFDLATVTSPDGSERRLDPVEVGGTDQIVQASTALQRAITTDRTGAMCAEIAGRLDESGTVEIVSEFYDAVGWFEGDRLPVDRVVRARCRTEANQ